MAERTTARILALESSGNACAAALAVGEELIAETLYRASHVHDRLLATSVQRLLQDIGWEAAEVDCVAVSGGPGSFTGLRIGAALAKSLCFDGKPALTAVPTSEALALRAAATAQSLGKEQIHVLIDSHGELLYRQIFKADAQPLGEVELLARADVAATHNSSALYCGPALPAADLAAIPSFEELNFLSAAAVARLGAQLYAAGRTVDPQTFVPLYAQEFVPKLSKKSM